jgi:hypothetical protein
MVSQPKRRGSIVTNAFLIRKKMLAGSSLYVAVDHVGPIDGIKGELVGVIQQCPRAANDHRFYIDWLKTVKQSQLRNYYPATDKTKDTTSYCSTNYYCRCCCFYSW